MTHEVCTARAARLLLVIKPIISLLCGAVAKVTVMNVREIWH